MPGPGTWSAGDILTAADLNAIGVWTSYAPALEQSGTRSSTVNYAEYCVINKVCFLNVDLTCTTTGSAGNAIRVTLPVNGDGAGGGLGSGQFFDSSGSDVTLLTCLSGTTNVQFNSDDSSGIFGISPSIALGVDDVISFSIIYKTV